MEKKLYPESKCRKSLILPNRKIANTKTVLTRVSRPLRAEDGNGVFPFGVSCLVSHLTISACTLGTQTVFACCFLVVWTSNLQARIRLRFHAIVPLPKNYWNIYKTLPRRARNVAETWHAICRSRKRHFFRCVQQFQGWTHRAVHSDNVRKEKRKTKQYKKTTLH